MTELARLVPFIFNHQQCLITDKEGNPWFAAKDVCDILGIKKVGRTFKEFPDSEKSYVVCGGVSNTTTYRRCDGVSKHGTSGKSRARKTQKLLIINEAGVMRLILKSRKPNAWEFKERIIQFVVDCQKRGINWACLPKRWVYQGQELTWGEWVTKREKAYFARWPDKTWEDFMRSLPY
jgi:prophage antirepressor-like protein